MRTVHTLCTSVESYGSPEVWVKIQVTIRISTGVIIRIKLTSSRMSCIVIGNRKLNTVFTGLYLPT